MRPSYVGTLGNLGRLMDHKPRKDVPYLETYWNKLAFLLLKRCTRSLSKPRSYEETMCCRFDPAPEPMPAEAPPLSPPCCVSTHRSRVVDPDGPTTFLDHREALFGIPQMPSFTQGPGHLERFPVEYRLHPYLRTHTGERRHARGHLAHVDQTSHRCPSAA